MDNERKEVYFNQYCGTCLYNNIDILGNPEIIRDDDWKNDPEFFKDPDRAAVCHDCLNQPYNWNSHKPVNYKDKEAES